MLKNGTTAMHNRCNIVGGNCNGACKWCRKEVNKRSDRQGKHCFAVHCFRELTWHTQGPSQQCQISCPAPRPQPHNTSSSHGLSLMSVSLPPQEVALGISAVVQCPCTSALMPKEGNNMSRRQDGDQLRLWLEQMQRCYHGTLILVGAMGVSRCMCCSVPVIRTCPARLLLPSGPAVHQGRSVQLQWLVWPAGWLAVLQ